MANYRIKYRDDMDVVLRKESILMRNLSAAKISASIKAPFGTESIEIYDITDKLLSVKELGKWKDHIIDGMH